MIYVPTNKFSLITQNYYNFIIILCNRISDQLTSDVDISE